MAKTSTERGRKFRAAKQRRRTMIDKIVEELSEDEQAEMVRGTRFEIEHISDGLDIVHWTFEPKIKARMRELMAEKGLAWDDVMYEFSDEIMYRKLQQQRAKRRRI